MSRDVALLQLMLTPGLGARSIGKIVRRLQREQYPVEDFVAASLGELEFVHGLPRATAEALADAREEALELAEALRVHEIAIVTLGESCYPERLARRLDRSAPPLLFLRGKRELLTRPMVAFAGARNCSEAGMTLSRRLAGWLGGRGVGVVSGYAPGIDAAAHYGTLEGGGVTIAVLASGILHFSPRAELAELSDDGNTVILSEYFPTMPWKSHSAMQRNRTICGLAAALVIVEAGETGGTMAAGKAALEMGCPLYVIDWPEATVSAAGNAELIRRGGRAVIPTSDGLIEESLLAELLARQTDPAGRPSLFD